MPKFAICFNAPMQLTSFLVLHTFSLSPLRHVLKIVSEKEAKGRVDAPLPQEAHFLLARYIMMEKMEQSKYCLGLVSHLLLKCMTGVLDIS